MDLDPRPEERRTRDGEGPRWHVVREATLERDDHTCQRCGYRESTHAGPDGGDARGLEAYDTASYRGRASPADEDRLVTVCRPCHATLHPADPAYGDLAASAPLFPRPDAPAAVATMRTDRQHVCQRCQRSVDAATDLAAYRPGDGGETYVLCEPCAGPLLAAGYDPADFEAAGDLDVAALASRADEAPVRPVLLAPGPARALRPPETGLERLVFDTPLRFLANPFGLTALFGGGGVFVSFWLF
jgi:hypothetical protein